MTTEVKTPKPATRSVGLRRLEMVARKLDTMKKEPTETSPGFFFGDWVGSVWDGGRNLCNTTGCILGLAATIPACYRAGLRLVLSVSGNGYVCMEHNKRRSGPEAAAEVFALTDEEANWLVFPGKSPRYFTSGLPDSPKADCTPQEAAAHVRRFIAWAQGKLKAEKEAARAKKEEVQS